MTDADDALRESPPTTDSQKGFWDRHAKLSIILIAASFYVILIAMCATVFILLWLRY